VYFKKTARSNPWKSVALDVLWVVFFQIELFVLL
jgi:hypothetical protein